MARTFRFLGPSGARWATHVVAAVLVAAAAVPIVVPYLDPQPEDVGVQQIFDGDVEHPDGWIRLSGRVTPLRRSPTGESGQFSLLTDAADPLRAIVLEGDRRAEPAERATVTGVLVPMTVQVDEELPIEATVAGTPPRIVPDRLVRLDPTPKPERIVPWPLSILPLVLAVMLFVGSRVGYPVFRRTTEVAVLTAPLAPGERVPAAYGGRIGATVRELIDPGGALLLARRGEWRTELTAQALADEGPSPPPVTLSGSSTNGRIGAVHTLTETIAALWVSSENVEAIFLFARPAERNRVAALIAVDR